MRIYWSYTDIPEIATLPEKEQKRIWRAAYGKIFRHRLAWAGALVCFVWILTGMELGKAWLGTGILGRSVGAALGGGLAAFLWFQIAIRLSRPYIREQIALMGSNGPAAAGQVEGRE